MLVVGLKQLFDKVKFIHTSPVHHQPFLADHGQTEPDLSGGALGIRRRR
jgi:hypothetical protein